jgi:transposase InsO family protein
MPTASNSPAKACAGHEANRTRRLDQPPSPVTQIHRPARLATRVALFRYGGRHHSGIPGDIIPLYPGDFVGIRNYYLRGDLERQIEAFVEHYNHVRYYESLNNLTPADVYFDKAEIILAERERIKRTTIANRRLQHQLQAA